MKTVLTSIPENPRPTKSGFTLVTVLIGVFIVTSLFTMVLATLHGPQAIFKTLIKKSDEAKFAQAALNRASLVLISQGYELDQSSFLQNIQTGQNYVELNIDGEIIGLRFWEKTSKFDLSWAVPPVVELELKSIGIQPPSIQKFLELRIQNTAKAKAFLTTRILQLSGDVVTNDYLTTMDYGSSRLGFSTAPTLTLQRLANNTSTDRQLLIEKIGNFYFEDAHPSEFLVKVENGSWGMNKH